MESTVSVFNFFKQVLISVAMSLQEMRLHKQSHFVFKRKIYFHQGTSPVSNNVQVLSARCD